MSSAGIFRTIDRLGRVVLPVEFRRTLGIGDHDLVEVSLEGERVVVTKVERVCTFCGSNVELREHRSKLVCGDCVAQLAAVRPAGPAGPGSAGGD